jgi:hypothetical protein
MPAHRGRRMPRLLLAALALLAGLGASLLTAPPALATGNPSSGGYWLVGADSAAGSDLHAPIVGMAS